MNRFLDNKEVSMTAASSKYLLVIEDNPSINEALAWIFENEGIRVVTASNGLEALALLQNDPLPTVICLDILMPLMDGQAFRQHQKSDPRLAGIPTVIMSASLSKQEKLENFKNEIFLTKPLNLEKLFAIVLPHFN